MIDGLEQITEAITLGDKSGARRLLEPILRHDPSAEAWLLAARAMESDEKTVICLKKALELDPTNEVALRTSARLLEIMGENNVNQIIAHNSEERLLQYLDIAQPAPGSQNVGPDSEGVFEMLWDCQNCGTQKNLGKTHRFCPNCGTPQNPRWRYFPSDADKVRVEDHTFEGVDQVCASCGHLNGGAADFCGRCGAPLDNAGRATKIAAREKGEGMAFGEQDLQARLHQEYDAAVGRIAPQTAQPRSSRLKIRRWMVISGVVGALIACAAIIFILTRSEQKTVQVVDYRWERSIDVEVLRAVQGSGDCGSEPVGAYNINRRYEQVGSRQVPDGETCSNVQVDQGDGTFRQERRCQTRYRSEPIMGYVCYYTVNRWSVGRSVEAVGGRGDPVEWPALNLQAGSCVGCEREGTRSEDYILVLGVPDGGDRYECVVERSLWDSTAQGSAFTLEVNSVFNRPDCDTLKPA